MPLTKSTDDELLLEPELEAAQETKPLLPQEVDNHCYDMLLRELQLKHYPSPLNEKIQALIEHIEILKKENEEPVSELNKALANTISLLSHEMSLKEYKQAAEVFNKKSSLCFKILGALMIAVGIAAVATGIALAVTSAGIGTPLSLSIAATGSQAALAGIGFFVVGAYKNKTFNQLNDIAADVEKANAFAHM